MSLAPQLPPRGPQATFGSGGSEPYASALLGVDSNLLYLRETPGARVGRSGRAGRSGSRGSHPSANAAPPMDVSRWNAEADAADLSLLDRVSGPLLDIGCGPGRMVRAAQERGFAALGIDVSPTAVAIAASAGLAVINRSVFDTVPDEGTWQTALLVDGNIGIGGDITALLRRCAEILAPGGDIVVETHTDPRRERSYTGHVVDTLGRMSASFPWAEIGTSRLEHRARALGLLPSQTWTSDGRVFCRLTTPR